MLSGSRSTSRRCSSAIRSLPATSPGTVRKFSVTTCTCGSMPSIRIWRAAGVDAVGPWKVTTHGRVSRCSTVSSVLDGRVVGRDDADPLVAVEVAVRQVGDEPVREDQEVGAQQDLLGAVDRPRACWR